MNQCKKIKYVLNESEISIEINWSVQSDVLMETSVSEMNYSYSCNESNSITEHVPWDFSQFLNSTLISEEMDINDSFQQSFENQFDEMVTSDSNQQSFVSQSDELETRAYEGITKKRSDRILNQQHNLSTKSVKINPNACVYGTEVVGKDKVFLRAASSVIF